MEAKKPIDKKRKAIEQQIFYNLLRIIQEYPQYTIGQHIVHIGRRKDTVGEQLYEWDNEKLLKRFEDYKDELDIEFKPIEEDAY